MLMVAFVLSVNVCRGLLYELSYLMCPPWVAGGTHIRIVILQRKLWTRSGCVIWPGWHRW